MKYGKKIQTVAYVLLILRIMLLVVVDVVAILQPILIYQALNVNARGYVNIELSYILLLIVANVVYILLLIARYIILAGFGELVENSGITVSRLSFISDHLRKDNEYNYTSKARKTRYQEDDWE